MRIELRDGQWADVRERVSHGSAKRIMRSAEGDIYDFQTELTRAYATAWNILDEDGAAIPIDAPDAVDRMPHDIVRALFKAIRPLWRELNDMSPTPPSSDDSV
jgi:hypothetical protein